MAKYKISFDRKQCIGAAECDALNPKLWLMADDGKANLIRAKLNSQGLYELMLDDTDLELNKTVAKSCPAGCIKIAPL
jgi:ferredoxin